MDNNEKYLRVFTEALGVGRVEAETMKYHDTQDWDSVGHMNLIAALEDAFDIMMDTDDVIEFSSYKKGKEILSGHYGITF